MSMDTIINPLPRTFKDGNAEIKVLYYDVDDGIYFEGDKDAKDRNSTATYHDWVVKAVTGHTDKDPIDKTLV